MFNEEVKGKRLRVKGFVTTITTSPFSFLTFRL